MKKWGFWMALIALMLSLGTIATIIMNVWSISVIDSNSFISAMIGLMTLVFTLLIGYQIYNALEIKEKIQEIDDLKLATQKAYDEINYLKADVYDGVYTVMAKACDLDPKNRLLAFYYTHKALRYALDTNEKLKDYIRRIKNIEKYALNISDADEWFNTEKSQRLNRVENIRSHIQTIDKEIKSHPKFEIIEDKYNLLMEAVYLRLNKIGQGKPVSRESIYNDLQH